MAKINLPSMVEVRKRFAKFGEQLGDWAERNQTIDPQDRVTNRLAAAIENHTALQETQLLAQPTSEVATDKHIGPSTANKLTNATKSLEVRIVELELENQRLRLESKYLQMFPGLYPYWPQDWTDLSDYSQN